MILDRVNYIHFVGIGGISMSGLALILAGQGYKVSGSDLHSSEVTAKLEARGIKVSIGHSGDNITNPELVVYTAAVKADNPELRASEERGIHIIDRAALLGEIMKKYDYSVAVSGTHGKTTTTAMVSMILMEAGLDPSVHIGGMMKAIGGSVRTGNGSYFVTEACEYVDSFLTLFPYISIILNIEYDHADYFKNIEQVKGSFLRFAKQTKAGGLVVLNSDDKNALDAVMGKSLRISTFGLHNPEANWGAGDISYDSEGCAEFTLLRDGKATDRIKLGTPGIHNIYNALAATAACAELGCGMDAVKRGLSGFTGMDRRLERKGVLNGIRLIDDYAHHPSEIKASLAAIAKSAPAKVWCVFQPHTYTRTKALLKDFAAAFGDADRVLLTDIYAAREKNTGEIHSSDLACEINAVSPGKAVYTGSFGEAAEYLLKNAKPGELVVTMGAGDVFEVGKLLIKALK